MMAMSKFEVSFNSPQCGWMSIGFTGSDGEFHTTTSNMPHANALSQLMRILVDCLNGANGEQILHWNRDPEEFDFRFVGSAGKLTLEIFEYPTGNRETDGRELVFKHSADAHQIGAAFLETFRQLYADRETDEFEFNWRQPFPIAEFRELEGCVEKIVPIV